MYAGKAISAETTLNLWWSIAPVNTASGASCVWDILRSADTLLIATADCCKRGGSTVCSSACDHNQNRLISPINLDAAGRYSRISPSFGPLDGRSSTGGKDNRPLAKAGFSEPFSATMRLCQLPSS